jgi:chemosensory pili system protein ChpA (sensor histidine kinase/response regulator)
LTFPYTTQDSPTTPAGNTSADSARDRGALRETTTVLVAEDDDDIRLLMLMLLRMKGYKTAEARDGQETLEVAQGLRPDVILMDLQLPRLNGFAVARYVRQTETLRNVPIIVVSAHDPAKHRNLALAAGCNAYVQKPIDFDSLDGMILNLVSSRRQAVNPRRG